MNCSVRFVALLALVAAGCCAPAAEDSLESLKAISPEADVEKTDAAIAEDESQREKKSYSLASTCVEVHEPGRPSYTVCNNGAAGGPVSFGGALPGAVSFGGGVSAFPASVASFSSPSFTTFNPATVAHVSAVPVHSTAAVISPHASFTQFGGLPGFGFKGGFGPHAFVSGPSAAIVPGFNGASAAIVPGFTVHQSYRSDGEPQDAEFAASNIQAREADEAIQAENEFEMQGPSARSAYSGGFGFNSLPVIPNILPQVPFSHAHFVRPHKFTKFSGANFGSVGLFPSASASASTIPLSVSCEPKVMQGSMLSGQSGFGGLGGFSGVGLGGLGGLAVGGNGFVPGSGFISGAGFAPASFSVPGAFAGVGGFSGVSPVAVDVSGVHGGVGLVDLGPHAITHGAFVHGLPAYREAEVPKDAKEDSKASDLKAGSEKSVDAKPKTESEKGARGAW